MKKFEQYFTLFFALYNLFLVIVAAFNLFNFPEPILRLLLGLEALQVAIYKICDVIDAGHTVPRCGPESTMPAPAPIKIIEADAHILKLRHADRHSAADYEAYEKDIKKGMAQDLGEEMLKNKVIRFGEQKDYSNNCVTVIAEVDVIKY